MHEPQIQDRPAGPRSESRIPLSLFEAMSRWYFGGSAEKDPPLARKADPEVTISDAWMGILCLSYFGNGPRHPSVTSGGTPYAADVPAKETVVQYSQVRNQMQMVPGGFAARKAQVKNGKRSDQVDQGSDGSGSDHRRTLRTGDQPVGVPEGDVAGGVVLPDGGPAV